MELLWAVGLWSRGWLGHDLFIAFFLFSSFYLISCFVLLSIILIRLFSCLPAFLFPCFSIFVESSSHFFLVLYYPFLLFSFLRDLLLSHFLCSFLFSAGVSFSSFLAVRLFCSLFFCFLICYKLRYSFSFCFWYSFIDINFSISFPIIFLGLLLSSFFFSSSASLLLPQIFFSSIYVSSFISALRLLPYLSDGSFSLFALFSIKW